MDWNDKPRGNIWGPFNVKHMHVLWIAKVLITTVHLDSNAILQFSIFHAILCVGLYLKTVVSNAPPARIVDKLLRREFKRSAWLEYAWEQVNKCHIKVEKENSYLLAIKSASTPSMERSCPLQHPGS